MLVRFSGDRSRIGLGSFGYALASRRGDTAWTVSIGSKQAFLERSTGSSKTQTIQTGRGPGPSRYACVTLDDRARRGPMPARCLLTGVEHVLTAMEQQEARRPPCSACCSQSSRAHTHACPANRGGTGLTAEGGSLKGAADRRERANGSRARREFVAAIISTRRIWRSTRPTRGECAAITIKDTRHCGC